MKKILGLLCGLLLTAFTYAQSHVTFVDASDSYNKAEVTKFHFDFDETVSGEDLEEKSSFYTDYFTVTVTPIDGGHSVTIELNQDDEMARKVVMRYFVTLEQETVTVQGEDMPIRDFAKEYIEL